MNKSIRIFHVFFYFIIETLVEDNKLIAVIPLLSTEWSLSFNLRIFETIGDYSNVIHFTKGANIGSMGDRVPYISTKPLSSELYITTDANHITDLYLGGTAGQNVLTLEQKHKIEMSQRYISGGKYRLLTVIDGNVISDVINTDARQYHNVQVYAGDPWHPPSNKTISDFQHTNFL